MFSNQNIEWFEIFEIVLQVILHQSIVIVNNCLIKVLILIFIFSLHIIFLNSYYYFKFKCDSSFAFFTASFSLENCPTQLAL